jgi:hypothetical protein
MYSYFLTSNYIIFCSGNLHDEKNGMPQKNLATGLDIERPAIPIKNRSPGNPARVRGFTDPHRAIVSVQRA